MLLFVISTAIKQTGVRENIIRQRKVWEKSGKIETMIKIIANLSLLAFINV